MNGTNWNEVDPVCYVRTELTHVKTDTQLRKEYSSVYWALYRRDLLDIAFPNRKKRRDWEKINRVEYAAENYPGVEGRTELRGLDQVLYDKLRENKELDIVFPALP